MAVVGTGRDEGRLADLANAINDKDRVGTIAVDLTADDAPKRIVDLAVERWGRGVIIVLLAIWRLREASSTDALNDRSEDNRL